MKLVIKYEEEVRLFSLELHYHTLLAFIQAEFNLVSHIIQITFKDQQGDAIIIASDDDICILQSYFEGKEYVKIFVKASPNPTAQSSPPKQPQPQKVQAVKVKKIKNNSKPKKPKENQEAGKKKQKMAKEKEVKMSKAQEIKRLMSLAVAELVDQRIRSLIPCMQQQMMNPVRKQVQVQIIHKGYSCCLCLADPIEGIRYDCPSCPFIICSHCQQRCEHQHNLLKVKHVIQQSQKKSYIDTICTLLTKKQQQMMKKGESLQHQKKELKKQLKQDQQMKEKVKNAKKSLAQMFGVQPPYYHAFVKKYKKSSIEEIVKKYVEQNKIPEEEYKEKLAHLQNARLCKKFKRQGNYYKEFIRQHLHFDLSAIVKAIYKQGVEKKPKKEVQPVKKQAEQPKEVKVSPRKELKQQVKRQVAQQPIPRKLSSRIEGGSQVKGQTLEILKLMVEFFGPTHQEQYVNFIEAHKSHGKEQILQNWANKFSHISP